VHSVGLFDGKGREGAVKVYNVEPFEPVIAEKVASKEGAQAIARQLEEVLNRGAAAGWAFESYQRIEVGVRQGCLGLGATRSVWYGTLVFSKDQ
jgi:hypothetical protein